MVDLRGFEPLTSSMPWRRAPSYATGPFDLVPGSVINIHSLYAITGVPASIRHLTVPGYHGCFILVALRRVRSCVAALHQPATLCKGWTYYSCSPLVDMNRAR